MSWRCKHCVNAQWVTINDKRLIYCPSRKLYPNPKFIEAWGCNDFEDTQLKLFEEERRKDK